MVLDAGGCKRRYLPRRDVECSVAMPPTSRAIRAALACAALAACDGSKDPALDAAPPPPASGLRIADEARPLATALALGSDGETSLRVSLATDALECAALEKSYPERPNVKSGALVDFWLVRPLEADGSDGPWSFRSGYLSDARGGRGLSAHAAMLDDVSVAGDRITVRGLDLALGDPRTGHEVMWTGTVTARDCGRVPREAAAHDRPQSELEVSVAGRTLAIHGATVHRLGQQVHLRLTRAPQRCESATTEGYDFFLDLVLRGDPPAFAFAALQGDLFPATPSGSPGREPFKLTVDGDLDGAAPVKVEVEGKLDLRGYATSLRGRFEALPCNLASDAPPATSASGSPSGSAMPSATPRASGSAAPRVPAPSARPAASR
jgi:hypothetical protein